MVKYNLTNRGGGSCFDFWLPFTNIHTSIQELRSIYMNSDFYVALCHVCNAA
jgi:hypothetical protein